MNTFIVDRPIEADSWYTVGRDDLSAPLRTLGGPYTEAYARRLTAVAPLAASTGYLFEVKGSEILAAQPQAAEPREARQGVLPLPLPSGFTPARPALEARAGAPLGRSAELPLDLSGATGAPTGDRVSGVPASEQEVRAGFVQGVRRCTERGARMPPPSTSLPATDGVERGGCGDVASPFIPSWFAKEVVLVLAGAALFLLALAATRPEFSPLGVM